MKPIFLNSRITKDDLLLILRRLNVGDVLGITNAQTARNALNLVGRFKSPGFTAKVMNACLFVERTV